MDTAETATGELTYCIRGCTHRGSHGPDCPGTIDDVECPGCRPRRATYGLLDAWCAGRYTVVVTQIPDLIGHIRDHVQPGVAAREKEGKRTKQDAAPAPLAVTAVDVADDLYAALVNWALAVGDALHLSLPTIHGRRASRIPHEDRPIVGIRADGRHEAVPLADMLIRHANRVFALECVGDLIDELDTMTRHADRAFPREERPRYLPTPCRECDTLSLVRTAPAWFGDDSVIQCRTCNATADPTEYAWWTRRVLADQADLAAQEAIG